MEKWIIRILILLILVVLIISSYNNYLLKKDNQREHQLNRLRDSSSTINFIKQSKEINSLRSVQLKQDSILNIKINSDKIKINKYEKEYKILNSSTPFLPEF